MAVDKSIQEQLRVVLSNLIAPLDVYRQFRTSVTDFHDAVESFAKISDKKQFDEAADSFKESARIYKDSADTFREGVRLFNETIKAGMQAAQRSGGGSLYRSSGTDLAYQEAANGYRGSHNMLGSGMKMLGSGRPDVEVLGFTKNKGASAASGVRAAGGLSGLTAGLALAAAAALAAGMELYKAGNAAKQHSEELIYAQKRIAQVSPDMARVFANDNIRNIMRDRQTGSRTAWSADVLANTKNDLADTLQPMKDLGTNLSNLKQGMQNWLLSKVLGPLEAIGGKANEWLEQITGNTSKKKGALASTSEWFEGIAKRHNEDRARGDVQKRNRTQKL